MNDAWLLTDLLTQTTQIKWLFVFILVVFSVGLFGIAILVRLLKRAVDEDRVDNTFKEEAVEMLDKDDLDGVIAACKKKLTKYPKEMHAHWYLSQAYFRKKEYHKAMETLSIIAETSPSWKQQYVMPYINEIREKLKNAKPEIVKS